MNQIRLKYKPQIGILINDELVKWNISISEFLALKLFNTLLIKPSISIIKSRFNRGVKFLDFHLVELEKTVAIGFNYRFGFNEDDKLIEFSSPWNFNIECNNVEIRYGSNYIDLESLLVKRDIKFKEIEIGSTKIQDWNIIYSKSDKPEANWNKGMLIEYLHISNQNLS